jgi:hypothetical protein
VAIAFVAQTVGSGASSASQAITLSGTIGNLMLLCYARSGGLATGSITGITDTGGNTWAMITRGAVSGSSNTRIECWATIMTASPGTVTVASGTAQTNSWNANEWSGVATTYADVASPDGSATTSSTTVTALSVTTTASADLVVAAAHFGQTTTSGLTGGWTALTDFDDAAVGSGRAAWQLAGAAGSVTGPSWTLGTAKAAGICTVSFFAAAVAAAIPDVTMAPRG